MPVPFFHRSNSVSLFPAHAISLSLSLSLVWFESSDTCPQMSPLAPRSECQCASSLPPSATTWQSSTGCRPASKSYDSCLLHFVFFPLLFLSDRPLCLSSSCLLLLLSSPL